MKAENYIRALIVTVIYYLATCADKRDEDTVHMFVMLQDLESLQRINMVYSNNFSLQPEYTTDLSRLEWKDHKLSTYCIFPVLLK